MTDRPARTVLAAVDFSRCSRQALEQARRLAAAFGAGLQVLHVVEATILEDLAQALHMDRDRLRRELLDDAQRHLRDLCGPQDAVQLDVVAGEPPQAVLARLEASPVELLVLGVRGESEGVGSLATACARRSPAPVLLVHEDHEGPFRSIVAGVDFSVGSRKAVLQALRIARADGARLAIVHGFSPPWERLHYRAPTREAAPHYQRQYREALEDRLRFFVAELAGGGESVAVEHELYETGNHGEGLVNCARRREADLVVVGRRGRSDVRVMLMGNTAERVLRAAATSVLVVPPGEGA